MDAEELGRYLRLTSHPKPGRAANAVNQRIRRGHPMPPEVQISFTKRRLWHRAKVDEWLLGDIAQHTLDRREKSE